MLEKQQIIISYFRLGFSQRRISRELQISRKTVKKYITEYEDQKNGGLTVDGIIQAPSYDISLRSKTKLTDGVMSYINQCLAQNDIKRQRGWSKQCMANTDIHEGLQANGHDISYSTVCQYVRQYHQKNKEIFIKQSYNPGSQSEFDWGYVKLNIGGKIKSLMLAVFTLAYSNYRWAMLFYRQDMPSFLQAHVSYFAHIKGVPTQLVYDNMKTAVAKYANKSSDKKPTQELLKISSYYQFGIRFCNARKGNEKGHVEKSVAYTRRKAFCNVDEFESLEHANQHLIETLKVLNDKSVKRKTKSIAEDLIEEQKHFTALSTTPYDYAIIQSARLDKYHTISIDANQYSVPESIATPVVQLKVLPNYIHIYGKYNKCVAIHQRLHAKYQWVINIDHYWNTLSTKPGALNHATAMKQAPPLLRRLYMQHYQTIPKVFITLMLHCKKNNYTLEQLQKASIQCRQKCPNTPLSVDKVALLLQNMNHTEPTHKSQDIPTKLNQTTMSEHISKNCISLLKQVQAQIIQSNSN